MKGCVSVSRWGWGSNRMCRVKKLHLKLYAKIWSGASNLSLTHLALRRSEKSLCSYFPPKASWVSPVAPLLKSTVLNILHLPITQRVLSVWSSPLSSTPPHPSLAISASSFRVQSRWLFLQEAKLGLASLLCAVFLIGLNKSCCFHGILQVDHVLCEDRNTFAYARLFLLPSTVPGTK